MTQIVWLMLLPSIALAAIWLVCKVFGVRSFPPFTTRPTPQPTHYAVVTETAIAFGKAIKAYQTVLDEHGGTNVAWIERVNAAAADMDTAYDTLVTTLKAIEAQAHDDAA